METRKEFIKKFAKYLASEDSENEHILLNGKWGSGKTYTIEKTKEILDKNDDVDVIYFNSWKYDYHTYPQFALVESILDQIAKENNDGPLKLDFLENAKEYAEKNESFSGIGAINTLLGSLLNVDFSKVKITEDFSSNAINTTYNKIVEENIYATALNYLIEKKYNANNIIIFIDELDRVRPEFCINTIEFFHHLMLEKKKITVIYSADLDALISLINHFYGFGQCSVDYIEKAIQTVFNIPNINADDYTIFIKELGVKLEHEEEKLRFGRFPLEAFSNVLVLQEITLRSVERITKDMIVNEVKDQKEIKFWEKEFDEIKLRDAFDSWFNLVVDGYEGKYFKHIHLHHCTDLMYILKYIQLTNTEYKLTLRDSKKRVELSCLIFKILKILKNIDGSNTKKVDLYLEVAIHTETGTNYEAYVNNDIVDKTEFTGHDATVLSSIYVLIDFIMKFDKEKKLFR